jgi:hypothetical protein
LSPGDIYALTPLPLGVATAFFAAYALFIFRMEKKEFARLPVIGRFVSRRGAKNKDQSGF